MNSTNIDARNLRRDGRRVIFRDGRVVIGPAAGGSPDDVRATHIDRGAWMRRPLSSWGAPGASELLALDEIGRVCYCATLDSGCDFCNGTRPVPDAI